MALGTDDIVALQQLYARYNHLIDAGDGEKWAALFVEDGTLDTGMGFTVEGNPAARIEFAAGVPVMMPGGRHIATNVLVDGDGDEASGAAYLQLWVADDENGGFKILVSGIYRDTLRRQGGSWKFVTRVLEPDTAGTPS
ncbi:MAG: nuclear transport factor 2 family protein [Microthrixaceae bacterium]